MACTFCRMLLLFTHVVIVYTAAIVQWNPGTKVSKPEADGTVYVTVGNPLQHAQQYHVCMKITGLACYGTVQLLTVTDIVRFKVTNLTANNTYFVEIKPQDASGQALDDWIRADQAVFIPPGATPAPTTVTTTTTSLPVDNTLMLRFGVPLTLLMLMMTGGLATFYLRQTGYWRKIRSLRCCGLWSLLGWNPPAVLQLYVMESPQFSRFILTHGMFLERVLGVSCFDCQQARDSSDPEKWMKSLTSTHHVLIYTSPILMSHIRVMQGEGSAEDLQDSLLQESQAKTHIQVCLEIIELLCSCADQQKRRLDRVGVVFVFSGCLDSDTEDAGLLQRYFQSVPHFTVVKQGSPGTCLESPHSLVSHLSGGRNNVYGNLHNCDWAGSAEAEELRGAAAQLKGNNPPTTGLEPQQSRTDNACITVYVDVDGEDVTKTTVDLNGVDVVTVHPQRQNFDCNRSTNIGAGKALAPPDSGFSSAANDVRGRSFVSGSSSLPVQSPGRLQVERGLTGTLPKPWLRGHVCESASHATQGSHDAPHGAHLPADGVGFVPPQIIGSDVNIAEQCRLLNETTEQHWLTDVRYPLSHIG